jgi:hypothetical protein
MENSPSERQRPPPELVLEVMRDLGHGRIENLGVTAGAPHINGRTKLLQLVRHGRHAPPPEQRMDHSNRKPHRQHDRLLAHCRAVGNGVIKKVEIADGLPVHWDSM